MTNPTLDAELAEARALAARLLSAANDAENWSDSFAPKKDAIDGEVTYRQRGWLNGYVSAMRAANATITSLIARVEKGEARAELRDALLRSPGIIDATLDWLERRDAFLSTPPLKENEKMTTDDVAQTLPESAERLMFMQTKVGQLLVIYSNAAAHANYLDTKADGEMTAEVRAAWAANSAALHNLEQALIPLVLPKAARS